MIKFRCPICGIERPHSTIITGHKCPHTGAYTNYEEIDVADPTDEDPLYSTARVSEILGVTTETIRNWIASGKIKGEKANNRWHIRRSETLRLANEMHGE